MKKIIASTLIPLFALTAVAFAATNSTTTTTTTTTTESRNTGANFNAGNSEDGTNAMSAKDELKDVNKEQNDSDDRVSEAMRKVENRNGLLTFLIGTDYKNLGALRSELNTTENGIRRLEKAQTRTSNPTLESELQSKIDALKAANTKVRDFISANESRFSFLGWFFKLFN
ncbi:MAG: hypothetical protein Q7R85_00795 [bacterium]|nr:hypothetical protein [bacterium]